ncbi:hypothetical protein HPP92_023911 [Vanilla planifolia]|uniref:Uncharacterized protein n=1 Tax=Vanilla planifolia TaxID=51239 RepID=A0A835PRS3_VANPL|nr:hypothetical protein HPP92_024308 [Vanilla planifolia]KAG0456123.1 hypothetical protein HPP92_023911 [Vanilla planifolia]
MRESGYRNVGEMGEGAQCRNHRYRGNPAGGVCAFCLQEKLCELVTSSKSSNPFFSHPAYLSSPPSLPSFSCSSASLRRKSTTSSSRIHVPLNRSKSAVHRPPGGADIPRRKNFWSLLDINRRRYTSGTDHAVKQLAKEDETSIPASSPLGKRMGRSRSVGCGSLSRSFSGDFFERISNGLGDCALRRVASHREAKLKLSICSEVSEERRLGEGTNCDDDDNDNDDDIGFDDACRFPTRERSCVLHGRSKRWRWAFASPIRAFWPAAGGVAGFFRSHGVKDRAKSSIVQVGDW